VLPTFFGLGAASGKGAETKGIRVENFLPEMTSSLLSSSVRLQRLNEGDYYLIVPRHKT